jgi:hypothetical protein
MRPLTTHPTSEVREDRVDVSQFEMADVTGIEVGKDDLARPINHVGCRQWQQPSHGGRRPDSAQIDRNSSESMNAIPQGRATFTSRSNNNARVGSGASDLSPTSGACGEIAIRVAPRPFTSS